MAKIYLRGTVKSSPAHPSLIMERYEEGIMTITNIGVKPTRYALGKFLSGKMRNE